MWYVQTHPVVLLLSILPYDPFVTPYEMNKMNNNAMDTFHVLNTGPSFRRTTIEQAASSRASGSMQADSYCFLMSSGLLPHGDLTFAS